LFLKRVIGRGVTELVYSDPSTYTGPDFDPEFDFDDELVVMAKDLGQVRLEDTSKRPRNVQQVIIFNYIQPNGLFGSWALGLLLGHLGSWAIGLLGNWALGLLGSWDSWSPAF
jgi:hypothetical protein